MSKKLKIAYISVGKIDKEYYAVVLIKNKLKNFKLKIKPNYENQSIIKWLIKYSKNNQIKFNAIGLCDLNDTEKLATDLWLKLDIVPHLLKIKAQKVKDIEQACWDTSLCYDENHLVRVKMGAKRRVIPSYLTNLVKYQDFFSKQEFENIFKLSKEFADKKLRLIFINATPAGGGVAHMRHAMIRLYRLLGVNVSWHVLEPKAEIFNITKKKFHNVLQGVAPHNCILEEAEKNLYNSWINDNAIFFKKIFKSSDVVVIDDPQPSGLIPHIKKINPKAKIFYRSHIQIRADLINTRKTQQFVTWKFLWQFIKLADVFISHPIKEFVPNTVKKNKLFYLPPSTDPLDGLNKKLKKIDRDYYLSIFQKHLKNNKQKSLKTNRSYIVQIARFDPSKGIYDVIESYRKLCRRLLKKGLSSKEVPQLVIAGNGSIDDPESVTIYEEIRQILRLDSYAEIADDIKIARLPHCDQLLNTLLDNSLITLQLSHKEGFEFKVTEALMKGKPVIAYKAGGIPLQIKHGYSGFLADIGNTDKVADYAEKLILDKEYYNKISRQAKNYINHDYLTLNNCAKWLDLALKFSK